MPLSQIEKTFSEFFLAFLKYILNFTHFLKKDVPRSSYISKGKCSKKRG